MTAIARLPRIWRLSDPATGDDLAGQVARLRRGAGYIVRHYGHPARAALARAAVRAGRRQGVVVLVGGDPRLARAVGAAGVYRPAHARSRAVRGVVAGAHSLPDVRAAERAGARLIFVSPLHATASHPGARPLGRVRFGLIARAARVAVAALGGMDPRRFRAARAVGAVGWGAVRAAGRPRPGGSR